MLSRCLVIKTTIDSLIMQPANLMAFMHIYKCGGTTFNWMLQREFPNGVLYCEDSRQENKHIEKKQLQAFMQNTSHRYSALSSHLIRYNALAGFSFIVTLLRNPASRLLSAFNYDVSRGQYVEDMDSYIERRTDVMVWTLGEDFMADLDSGRVFCGILENFDLSMVCLEYLLSIHGHHVDLSAPKALNVGKHRIKNPEKTLSSLTSDQIQRIKELNQADYELYNSQLNKQKGFVMAIPELDSRLRAYHERKKNTENSGIKILSYGQGPMHFTFI